MQKYMHGFTVENIKIDFVSKSQFTYKWVYKKIIFVFG